jgi:hypothetical protein
VLREIFEALGNDPFVIAECLARPVLAERLVNSNPVAAGVPPASTKLFAADTAASCILAFQPFGCKTERLRDPGCLGSG